MSEPALLETNIPGVPCRRGKVRDVYDLGDHLVIVATDRISAFDWIMPNGIPGKGKILTRMSRFWFDWLGVANHWLSDDVVDFPEPFPAYADQLAGRAVLAKKAKVVPIECVARGYLLGSGWKEYQQSGTVCGLPLPVGLVNAEKLPDPIFTPTTKADTGHDQNISFEIMAGTIGLELANELRQRTLQIYNRAAEYAAQRGIIIADTKLEWGQLPDGELILIDEVLTPDSSRFWPVESYVTGKNPPSFDKQFVRDWLETTGWDKQSPPPELPSEIIEKSAAKYQEALQRLTS